MWGEWSRLAILLTVVRAIMVSPNGHGARVGIGESERSDSRSGRPHIIVILADDLGWNDVSFHGSDQIPTPNIDALAYNGVVLNSHYVAALCTPSRAALLTGKYPIRLGMQHSVLLEPEPRGLPLREKLLPQHLKQAGYRTHAIGKWHLGYHRKEYTPTYRGFDSHFGYWNGLQDYYTHEVEATLAADYRGFDMRRNMSVAWDTVGKYSTDLFTEEAVRLIEAHDYREPMFMYLAHLAPHTGNRDAPFQAPDEEIAKFTHIDDPERRIYAAMVSKLDQSIGEVIGALRRRDMLANCIVLFMSDNGAPTMGIHSNRGSNYPMRGVRLINDRLRGRYPHFQANDIKILNAGKRYCRACDADATHRMAIFVGGGDVEDDNKSRGAQRMSVRIKDSPWEGGVRSVAALWSPLIEETNRVSNQLMYVTDWLPTFYAAAGMDPNDLGDIDGIDMWPALRKNKASPRSEIVVNIDDVENYAAIRKGDFKYVIGMTSTGDGWSGETGRSSSESPQEPGYDPDAVLRSKAGIALAGTITAAQVERLRRTREGKFGHGSGVTSPSKILTSNDIKRLRNEAELTCNVDEAAKVPCNSLASPCLFNIREDPCEMVNLARSRPLVLATLEEALMKHRLTAIPASNVEADSNAQPAHWNGTWVNWRESDPMRYSQSSNSADLDSTRIISGPAIAAIAVCLGLITVVAIGLFATVKRRRRRTVRSGTVPERETFRELYRDDNVGTCIERADHSRDFA